MIQRTTFRVLAGSTFLLAHLQLIAQLSEVKLVPSDGTAEDLFGSAVGVSQNLVIIGSPQDDEAAENGGAGYVFRWDGTSWSETGKLLAGNAAPQDFFGSAVDISGDRAIVGASGVGPDRGAAYVFRREGAAWTEEAVLTSADIAPGDFFGATVAIDGDLALVGAYGHGSASGAAYVFRRIDTTWLEVDKLTASDGASSDYFGVSVALAGNYALVGALWDDDNGLNSGSAYLFRGTGSVWTEEAKLTPTDGQTDDWFGFATAISGDFALIGAYGDDDGGMGSGSAYIFRRNGSTWSEMTKLVASDAATNDFFGYAVGIAESYAVVGAGWDDDMGGSSGSVYLFHLEGTTWKERTKLTASDGAESDNFGRAAAVSQDFILAGSPQDDDAGTNSGSAYVFTGFDPVPSVGASTSLPASIELLQVYPNPFNGSAKIIFTLERRQPVILQVFDMLGREVATLVDGLVEEGEHRVEWRTDQYSSGMFFCRLQTGSVVETRKMVYLR